MSGGTPMKQVSSTHISELMKYVRSPLSDNEDDIKKREESLLELGQILADTCQAEQLCLLIQDARPFFISIGAAKAVKIIRRLVELCLKIPGGDDDVKVSLCLECIQWAKEQNRVYLRQILQARLVRLYNDLGRYLQATQLASELIHELKRLEDKDLIIEVQLENSKACYSLSSYSKARASLVFARTVANSMYIPPRMQASLDMQSGILHAGVEHDFKTAFSYFFESFEGFDSVGDKEEALRSLKYMLLCQIMLGNYDEVKSLLMHKTAMKYTSTELDAMVAISEAVKNRSMADFNVAFGRCRDELQCDSVVRKHLHALSSTMLEKDLCRLLEPYSQVQIAYIAKMIKMDVDKVEKKLSQMILDKKFSGCIHQGD
uniref:PCI domain-containing protein n=1 Tax=Panagrolaimus sp. JU765 TaxID=591449 RepID=A0AC34QR58_9BILA